MISVYKYQLPFSQPFVTAAGTFNERCGIIIHFDDGTSQSLVEASPLPGFSVENIDDVTRTLKALKSHIQNFLISNFDLTGLKQFLNSFPMEPSLSFAISYMGMDLLIQREKATLEQIFNRPIPETLSINKVIGHQNPDRLVNSIKSALDEGFTTLKFKSLWPPENLTLQLKKISIKYPVLRFRLDANQSWPVNWHENYDSFFSGLPIEYVEEPIKLETTYQIELLFQNSTLPIALDETLSDKTLLNFTIEKYPKAILVLKPTVVGNLFNFYETILQYRGLENNVVVTTALESAIGRKMVQNFALIIGDSNRAHGLDTGYFFEKDFLSNTAMREGRFQSDQTALSLRLYDIDTNLMQPLK
jgi:o-succinylbenzoate synthase